MDTQPLGLTHLFTSIVLVAVRLHIPNYLMTEELGYLGCLEYEALDVAQGVMAQRLHDLGHKEKCEVDWVLYEYAMRVL